MNETVQKIARFLLVGGSATALHYVLLVLGVQAGLGPITAVSGAAFLVSAVYNFFLTRSFTFRSGEPIRRAAPRFALMVGLGLALNTAVMAGLLWTGLHYLVAQVVATGVVLAFNFLAASRWVFRERA